MRFPTTRKETNVKRLTRSECESRGLNFLDGPAYPYGPTDGPLSCCPREWAEDCLASGEMTREEYDAVVARIAAEPSEEWCDDGKTRG